ncbi:LysR substrate-binding domain-containing protein [Cyanobium sp. FGCU-52]|nr:LysR substrate-binding domain-containing protein [Cyanobium sp. FGCU52]
MVVLDVLQALDGLQWLGSGEEVAKRFGVSQSTVSRSCAKALRIFGLRTKRRNGEWDILGDPTYLQLERTVHQQARRLSHRPLRLEATYWSAPVIAPGLPASWMLGRSNIVGVSRNVQLVEERVVDGWLAGLPDLPGWDHPALTAIVLSRMPVFFTCAPGHPLLDRPSITLDDIADDPTLALPAGAYPLAEDALKRAGLWNNEVRMGRYRRERWEGRTEAELVIGYGTPLSMHVSGGQLRRLPLRLPFASGDALVIRRDFLGHARLEELLHHIRLRLRTMATDDPEIEVIEG